MIKVHSLIALAISFLVCVPVGVKADNVELLITRAISQDPYLQSSRHLQNASNAKSIAAGQLQDPKLRVNYANIPIDSFDTNQEPFTQFQVGISQRFPGGKSRSLKSQQQKIKSTQHALLSQNRRAEIRREITKLWVSLLAHHYSFALVKRDRAVFEQLYESVRSGYANGVASVSQQELLNAELELARFDDRMLKIESEKNKTLALFSEYLPVEFVTQNLNNIRVAEINSTLNSLDNSSQNSLQNNSHQQYWPDVTPVFESALTLSKQEITKAVRTHPAVASLIQGYKEDATEVEIQKQKYRPDWTLSAQYGYRENDPIGNSRADFISLGIEFDLPVLTHKRQAQSVTHAHETALATQLRVDQFVLTAIAQFNAFATQYQKITQREHIYKTRLIPQLREISASFESSYASGEGALIAALNARVDELNTHIELNTIIQKKYALIADLNYLTTQKTN